MGRLVSLNVGLPRDVAWRGETVRTAIWKQAVQGRRMARRLNVDGDAQGDLAGHGGEHRAVMVYQTDSYRYWEAQLGRSDFTFGQFGENLTVDGLSDSEVCIGDQYRIGGALFEVTQPRVTCYRVGIRMGEPRMAALLVSHHRPGFYMRVLVEGEIGSGDAITKVADGPERISVADPERITVADIDALLYLPGRRREQMQRALRIPALSAGWKSSFQELLDHDPSQPGNPALTSTVEPPPAWSGFRPLRIARVDRESDAVVSLTFEQVDRAPLPAALPGQFLVLKLPVHGDRPPLLRNYSMSGAPGAGTYRVSIKYETNGAGSSFLHTQAKAGDVLQVSAPRGTFTLRAGEVPVILISAGIGATPVLSMLHSLCSTDSHRDVWWLYGARNRKAHPFAAESRRIIQSISGGRSHVVYSRPDAEDRFGVDYDSRGHLDVPLLDRLGVDKNSDFYLCGPRSFLDGFIAGLREWGVAHDRIHSEVFGPQESITPGIDRSSRPAAHLPSGTPGVGPRISFVRSGLTLPWDSRFSSLLELAQACDIPARWSCRTGVCHTCECPLIDGRVEYQPDPLEPPAEGNVLVCCSRPSGDVEIDL